MEQLLNSTLTDNDYKNLSIFSLLLSKGTPDNFEHHVLNLLYDVFNFKHSLFFNCSSEGYAENIVKHNINDESIEDVINQYLSNNKYKIYSEQVILMNDPLQANEFRNTKYSEFMRRNNLFYDMHLIINDKGDGIRVFRSIDKGDFSDSEKEIANYLCKILAPQYKTIQENRKYKQKIDLYDRSIDNVNYGFMMLSKDFDLITSNKLAFCYSYDIYGSYDINNAINDFKKMIAEEFSDNSSQDHENSFQKSMKSFVVEVLSTMFINDDNQIDNYYIIHIYNKIWFKKLLDNINHTTEKYNLTDREKEIVSLVSKGLSNKEIADNLFISIYTVKEHIKNVSKKMNVNSRTRIISKLAI